MFHPPFIVFSKSLERRWFHRKRCAAASTRWRCETTLCPIAVEWPWSRYWCLVMGCWANPAKRSLLWSNHNHWLWIHVQKTSLFGFRKKYQWRWPRRAYHQWVCAEWWLWSRNSWNQVGLISLVVSKEMMKFHYLIEFHWIIIDIQQRWTCIHRICQQNIQIKSAKHIPLLVMTPKISQHPRSILHKSEKIWIVG